MYIYIYIYIYMYTYILIYIYVYVYEYTRTHTYTHKHINMCVRVCVCIHIYIYVLYICICAIAILKALVEFCWKLLSIRYVAKFTPCRLSRNSNWATVTRHIFAAISKNLILLDSSQNSAENSVAQF